VIALPIMCGRTRRAQAAFGRLLQHRREELASRVALHAGEAGFYKTLEANAIASAKRAEALATVEVAQANADVERHRAEQKHTELMSRAFADADAAERDAIELAEDFDVLGEIRTRMEHE